MALVFPAQDVSETISYTVNWATQLGSDTITSSSFMALAGTPTLAGTENTATTATVLVSGLTASVNAVVQNTIVTAGGQTFDELLIIPAAATFANYVTFLALFPEFANETAYPRSTIEAWYAAGLEQLNERRFGDQFTLAVCLFTAHNVVLNARELAASQTGRSMVGEAYGPVASKSIDKLSISYGATSSVDGAGVYNLTSYGQRLYKMIQTYGTGPFYVGARRRIGCR